MSTEDALISVLRDSAMMIERNALVMLLVDEPDGPHQFRVGLRRLRAMLKSFRAVIDREAARPIELWARELASAAGQWRDADVLLADIFEPAAAAGALDTGAAALKRTLETDRRKARAAARDALRALDPAAFLDLLGDFVREARWRGDGPLTPKQTREQCRRLEKPAARFAARALKRTWSRTAVWAERLEALTIEERHEMRKAIKALRYNVDFFAPLFEKDEASAARTAHFKKELRRLQNVFGYLNDVAMAEALRARFETEARQLDAVDALLDWHQTQADRAWTKARKRWRTMAETSQFW